MASCHMIGNPLPGDSMTVIQRRAHSRAKLREEAIAKLLRLSGRRFRLSWK
jgi:predicted house-cleaning NTP pyrophosphatase (Maf/HAM1 superfamily)